MPAVVVAGSRFNFSSLAPILITPILHEGIPGYLAWMVGNALL